LCDITHITKYNKINAEEKSV